MGLTGFLSGRKRAYSAAIRVERYRAAAEDLRASDPDAFALLLGQANGSEAEASAQRDPIAYVALFLAAADDAGAFPQP